MTDLKETLFETTGEGLGSGLIRTEDRRVVLTILSHPELRRIGEIARLPELAAGRTQPLSRTEPLFRAEDRGREAPLDDRSISRQPTRLVPAGGGDLRIDVAGTRTKVVCDGEPVVGDRRITAGALEAGVVVELAGRIALLLHRTVDEAGPAADLGLVGGSAAIRGVREDILRVRDLDVPVLIRGETGTGKELVASAIHQAGARGHRAHVSVNMASIPATLAATELFGHARGAFTGAVRDHAGHFERADGGTLFLDEVGDTPPDVQVMLLRVLETREIMPVGARQPKRVDVRLIAATDVDLEASVAAGTFRAPLLHRLCGYAIEVPPLRARRDDIGRLFAHFLSEEMTKLGDGHRLGPGVLAAGGKPLVPASLVGRLVRHDWPGNVRELRNVVRQIAIRGRGLPQLVLQPGLLRGTLATRELEVIEELPVAPASAGRNPSDVSEAELVDTLRANRWRVGPTAKALGIPKSSLYYLMEQCPRVRRARDIEAAELSQALSTTGGDLDALSELLEVSRRGIQLRIKQLDL